MRDIVASAFQSAGQRCSALRVLYIQREVEDRILEMLFGAMDRALRRRPVGPCRRHWPGDRRRGSVPHRSALRAGRTGGARAQAPLGAGRGPFRAADGAARPRYRSARRGNLRAGAPRRGLWGRRNRCRCRRRQRGWLRPHLRPAHAHRRPRSARRRSRARGQHLCQPQPDRCRGGLAALRRRRSERYRAEGRRPALRAAPHGGVPPPPEAGPRAL